jgi:uncharacterized protein (DUF1501 family)
MKNRRDFLKMCAAVSALGGAGRLLKAQGSPNFKALVCVFQFGGNDGNNTVVPLDSATYAQYATGRGGIAIPAGSLLPIQAQGKAYGLHPRFTELAPLYTQGRMASLANVGTLVRPVTKATLSSSEVPRNLYSHSDQTQQWQTSNPSGIGGTGWGGRAADVLATRLSIELHSRHLGCRQQPVPHRTDDNTGQHQRRQRLWAGNDQRIQ